MSDLRRAWTGTIEADDYERHMSAVGQAQANASLLEELFGHHAPPAGSRIHFAGAGTGHFFQYWPAAGLAAYDLVFSDINPEFLARLAARIQALPALVRLDDIEEPLLDGPFDLTIVVLVLEHVEWARAISAVCRRTARVFVVIQEDPPDPILRPLPGTLAVLRTALPHLVDRSALIEAFHRESFQLSRTSTRHVPDGKQMVGLDFTRRP